MRGGRDLQTPWVCLKGRSCSTIKQAIEIKTIMRHFSPLQLKTAASIWQGGVKSAQSLVGLLIRAIPLILGSTSLGWVKATFVFAKWAVKIREHQGQRGLAIHLKAANVVLLRYIAGEPLTDPRLAGAAVACTRTGLPRLIVGNHRKRIKQGDVGAIRFWLGLFTLYRVLDFKGKVSFSSVVGEGKYIPSDFMKTWDEFAIRFRNNLIKLGGTKFRTDFVPLQRLNPGDPFMPFSAAEGHYPPEASERTRHLYKKSYTEQLWGYTVRFIPLLKSGANSKDGSTSVMNIVDDCLSWITRPGFLKHLVTLVHLTRNWPLLEHPPWFLAKKREAKAQNHQDDSRIARALKDKIPLEPLEGINASGDLGRLHIVEEPGKMRVVAMVDCLTQWFLYPLHRFIFDKLLRVIPQDGTFDQMRPVKKLIESMREKGLYECFSYDLSAATDRIPVILQQRLLGVFTTQEFAFHWRHLLASRYFRIPKWCVEFLPKWYNPPWGNRRLVKYAVGQPMGAYSSWAMLALVHHAIVQLAAMRAGVESWFQLYAVLGDDVVIGDRGVALEYVRIMEEIGVNIGFHKSIISKNRSLEFAKRFFYKGVEVTPLPLVAIAVSWLSVNGIPEVVNSLWGRVGKFPSLYQIVRSMGFGFKAGTRAATSRVVTLPRRVRDAVLVLSRPGNLPWSRKDLWEWFRMRTTFSVADDLEGSRESVGRFLRHLIKSRSPESIRKGLYRALVPFTPPKAWAEEEVEMFEWWNKFIKQPYKDPLLAVINEYEVKIFEFQSKEFLTTEDLSALLELFEEIERLATRLPVKVELQRSMKDVIRPASSRFPKTVRRWRQVNRKIRQGSTEFVDLSVWHAGYQGSNLESYLRLKGKLSD